LPTESILLKSEWRQGAVLPHKLVPEGVLPQSATSEAKLIVISHDCDIVHPSYEAEPFVEFFLARPKDEIARDGRLFHGKNPRRFQFHAQENGKLRLHEIEVHEKYRMERKILESGSRDATINLSPEDVRGLAKWAARRHNRPSLPTAFLDRIPNAARSKLARKLEKGGEDILRILVGFNTLGELDSEKPYKIILRLVVQEEAIEDESRERRAISCVSEIRTLLSQCDGIQIEDADIAAESEISIYDLRHMIPWDFDYMSPNEDADVT
jgi:hypothetical protein